MLEAWRKVLVELRNRGLRRALLLVTDDFSGLLPLVKSLLPNTDHQLCTVHLLRNAQRHLPEAYQQLLQSILLGAKSFAAAQRSLQALGLGYSTEQVQALLQELHQQARAFFGRPLAADWVALFADAKIIELKDEQDQVKTAVHFLVLGLSLEGRKELLCATTFWGNEYYYVKWNPRKRHQTFARNSGRSRSTAATTDASSAVSVPTSHQKFFLARRQTTVTNRYAKTARIK